jgi:hypothetical protein
MIESIQKLCKPAYIYLVLSVISMIVLMFQNIGNTNKYCVGTFFKCNVPNTGMVFLGKGLYIALWTWFLDKLCRWGYKTISWVLVLAPFIMFFFTIFSVVFLQAMMIKN